MKENEGYFSFYAYFSQHFSQINPTLVLFVIFWPLKEVIKKETRDRTPLKPWFFFRLLLSNCLNWKIYCTAMIILHFHLELRFKYELFHIYITSFHSSRGNMNSINWPRSERVLHSSVGRASHRYRGGHGFESRWSPDFFRILLSNCFNWKIYCDDHSSLSDRIVAVTGTEIMIIARGFTE